jgi:hypothetical protein
MSDERNVVFKLNGKRPADFTIERLAKYLSTLSDLVGSPGSVRVTKITPGSVKVALAVDERHYPKFVEKLTSAQNPARVSIRTRKAIDDLEAMITDDHVTAEVLAGKTKLFQLRGYSRVAGPTIGPVIQPYSIRGQINRLEGRDATKHVGITEYGTSKDITGHFGDAALAVELRRLLWGPVVELRGVARLMRHASGIWELKSFRVDGVQELDAALPSAVLSQLRQRLEGVDLGNDPVDEIRRLRG